MKRSHVLIAREKRFVKKSMTARKGKILKGQYLKTDCNFEKDCTVDKDCT